MSLYLLPLIWRRNEARCCLLEPVYPLLRLRSAAEAVATAAFLHNSVSTSGSEQVVRIWVWRWNRATAGNKAAQYDVAMTMI